MHFSLKAILVALVPLTLAVPCADAQIQSAQFVAYPCQYKSVDEIAALLRPLLPKSPAVQLVIDRDQNRILLSGSNDLQAVALRLIRTVDRPPKRPQASTPQPPTTRPLLQPAPQAQLRPTANQGRTGRLVFVSPDRFVRLHQQLDAVFGTRLSLQRYGSREILLLALGSQPSQRLEIEFDTERRGVLIGGPTGAVNQLAALIQALDGGHQAVGTRAQVFRLDRKNHRSLQGIINSSPSGTVPRPASTPQADDSMGLRDPAQSASSVALVGYLIQEENPAPPVSPTGAGKPPNNNSQPGGYLRQFEGVEIEPLPDLDVIILRGRDGDLDQLTEIIQQLEKISKETQPKIRIYPLRHTQSQAVAELVSQVSADLVNNRTGKVTITPLVKPNSLLLIGWGDAVNAMIELIRRLDQPVAAQTQSAVFRLKFASATSVQETLNGFFANREGLGPRVQSTVDTRTNSIVVYAAPRDMMEVRHIIEKLDRPDSAAINRARIFQIRN
ncbi:MAG: hypothetical protein CMJ90_11050, partial [Planctomycetes bacterium]|nr:hypothetical protein [Planctomycetota bacterium]